MVASQVLYIGVRKKCQLCWPRRVFSHVVQFFDLNPCNAMSDNVVIFTGTLPQGLVIIVRVGARCQRELLC